MRLLPIALTSSLTVAALGIAAGIPQIGTLPTANAAGEPASGTIERIAGVDRYTTSEAVAKETGLVSVNVPESSPDALVSSLGAANDNKAAILSSDTAGIGGANRYDSAAMVALDGEPNAPVVIANGTSTVDILSATSYAAIHGGNLILSQSDRLGDYAVEALVSLDPSNLVIVGGTGVVSEATQSEAEKITGLSATRVAGANRYETAIAAANAAGVDSYLLVNGNNPVDAYTLAPLVKQRQAAIILVRNTCAPQNVIDFLNGKKQTIIGGTAAIADNFAAKSCEQEDKEAAAARAAYEAQLAAERQRQQEEAARQAALNNPYGAGTPQGIAYDMLGEFGWGKDQMPSLVNLWNRESGWNVRAGRVGGPYGIPQANPGSKMSSAGADWATNPATQIRWGLSYIKGRYGSPAGAWANFQRRGWY